MPADSARPGRSTPRKRTSSPPVANTASRRRCSTAAAGAAGAAGGRPRGPSPSSTGGAQDGVESPRAIPWQFAWTQTRLLLASWLGVEAALGEAAARGSEPPLDAMYDGWPFFRSTIDLIEMVLAKADSRIAALYDRELVPPDLRPLGEALRAKLDAATAAVLRVTPH